MIGIEKRKLDRIFSGLKILQLRIGLVPISNKQKGTLLYSKNALFNRNQRLDHRDVCSGRTFLSLLYVKGNLVAFIEGFKTG